MFAKLRPVGSPVPKPRAVDDFVPPWDEYYTALYTGSGTEALSLAVECALAAKPTVAKPEVIIPAYGCPDLIAAVVAQQATPVLVDFAPELPVMDEEAIASSLNENTVAVVAVDFLGGYERLQALSRLCLGAGIVLIEDSAQCFPPASASHDLADFVVLSFGRGKPINLMGGGALLTRRGNAFAEKNLRSQYPTITLRTNLKWRTKRVIFNALLSRFVYPLLERIPFLHVGETRFHALKAILILDIPPALLSTAIDTYYQRPHVHRFYDRELAFLKRQGWQLPRVVDSSGQFPRLRYALLAPDRDLRDQAVEELNDNGVGASKFYGCILPEIVDTQALEVGGDGNYPNASDFAARLITLPTHEGVKDADLNRIVTVLVRVSSRN
ncbi:DegT/DnrJ/EryC1/StrS family aminotransferase [Marinobacter salsuginis]